MLRYCLNLAEDDGKVDSIFININVFHRRCKTVTLQNANTFHKLYYPYVKILEFSQETLN